jgi:hypothetical protein
MSKQRLRDRNSNVAADNALFALRSTYGQWRSLLGSPSRTYEGERRFCEILAASIRFTGKTINDAHEAHQLHSCLVRGKELLSTALEWDGPSVGRSGSDTALLRGLQWRAVIAWSGLEQILKKLCNLKDRNDLARVIALLPLPKCSSLSPPCESLRRLDRWRQKDTGDDNSGINGFLQSESKESKEIFRKWLISGQPVETWNEVLSLAKVLRHATAHGALSATKVREWGLAELLLRLVPEVGVVAAAVFERMFQECCTILGSEACEPVVKHNRALSLPPPDAEAVLRGCKTLEVRSQRTTIIGRVYVYASSNKRSGEEEAAILQQYGIADLAPTRLLRGMLLGTIELYDCTIEDGCYHWHFRNPEKWARPKLPEGKAQGTWFTPFKAGKTK